MATNVRRNAMNIVVNVRWRWKRRFPIAITNKWCPVFRIPYFSNARHPA
jgi:hypothetical protein